MARPESPSTTAAWVWLTEGMMDVDDDGEGAVIFCCGGYKLASREGGDVAKDEAELEGVKLPPKVDCW